jgi:kynureninase
MGNYSMNLERARKLDLEDPLSKFRSAFLFPKHHLGKEVVYLAGNSLGLQPRKTKEYIDEVIEDWQTL